MISVKNAKAIRHADEGIRYIPILNNGIFSASYVFLGPRESVPPHRHKKTHHLYFVEKGALSFIIDGKESVVPEKNFLEIPPGKAHEIVNKGSQEAEFITFEVPPDDEDIEMMKK